MHWIAPTEKDTAAVTLEKRLWDAAEQAVPAPTPGCIVGLLTAVGDPAHGGN